MATQSTFTQSLISCALALSVSACSVVTINPVGTQKLRTNPDYKDSKPFYLLGVIGQHEVDVKHICADTEVVQMQTVHTPSDFFFFAITLGIYFPTTVKVWCSET